MKAIHNKYDIVGLVTEKGKDDETDPTFKFAKENDINTFMPKSFKNNSDGMALLESLKPDIAVLCVYEKIVPKNFIEFFNDEDRRGCINLHAGKVPEFRGSSVLRWQIRKGDTEGAFTILEVGENIDDNMILAEKRYHIRREMNINDVIVLEHDIFPKLLLDVLYDLNKGRNKIRRKLQRGLPQYWHKIQEDDRRIHWDTMYSTEIHNLIRSETKPYAGAFFYLNIDDGSGQLVKIRVWKSSILIGEIYRGISGRVVKTFDDGGVMVIAKEKGIIIKKVSYDEDNTNKIYDAKEILKVKMQLQ